VTARSCLRSASAASTRTASTRASTRVDAARRRGVDVRLDDVTGHLQAVAPGDLAGVVLRACVERMAAGELLQLLDLATRALRAGRPLHRRQRDAAGVGT
jgi:hypothetical protein